MVSKPIKRRRLWGLFSTIVLTCILIFFGVGCSNQDQEAAKQKASAEEAKKQALMLKKPIKFTILNLANAPKELQTIAKKNQERETITLVAINKEAYLLVTRGVKTTGGYNVELKTVNQELQAGCKIVVAGIKYTDPQPDQIVTQALTYPAVAAKLELKSFPQGISFVVIPPEQAVPGQT